MTLAWSGARRSLIIQPRQRRRLRPSKQISPRHSSWNSAKTVYRLRRVSPIALPPDEGLLSEPKAGTQPRRREPLFMPHCGPPSPAPRSIELVESGPSHLLWFVQLMTLSDIGAATHKRGDHHLGCGDHSRPPSEPFSTVLLKRMSAAVAMASLI